MGFIYYNSRVSTESSWVYPNVPELNVGPTSLNDFSDVTPGYSKTVSVIHDMSSTSLYKYTDTKYSDMLSATSDSVLIDNPSSKRKCATQFSKITKGFKVKYFVPYDKTSSQLQAESEDHTSYSDDTISYEYTAGDQNISVAQIVTDNCLPLVANDISFKYSYKAEVSRYQGLMQMSSNTIYKTWEPESSDIFSIKLNVSTFLHHAKFSIDYIFEIEPIGYKQTGTIKFASKHLVYCQQSTGQDKYSHVLPRAYPNGETEFDNYYIFVYEFILYNLNCMISDSDGASFQLTLPSGATEAASGTKGSVMIYNIFPKNPPDLSHQSFFFLIPYGKRADYIGTSTLQSTVVDIYGQKITNTMKIIVPNECDTSDYGGSANGSFFKVSDSMNENNTFIHRPIMLGEVVSQEYEGLNMFTYFSQIDAENQRLVQADSSFIQNCKGFQYRVVNITDQHQADQTDLLRDYFQITNNLTTNNFTIRFEVPLSQVGNFTAGNFTLNFEGWFPDFPDTVEPLNVTFQYRDCQKSKLSPVNMSSQVLTKHVLSAEANPSVSWNLSSYSYTNGSGCQEIIQDMVYSVKAQPNELSSAKLNYTVLQSPYLKSGGTSDSLVSLDEIVRFNKSTDGVHTLEAVANDDNLIAVYQVIIRSYMTGIDPFDGFYDQQITINIQKCLLNSIRVTTYQKPFSPLTVSRLEDGSIFQYQYVTGSGPSYIKDFNNTIEFIPNCAQYLPANLTRQNRLTNGTFVDNVEVTEVFQYAFQSQRLEINAIKNSAVGTYYFQVTHAPTNQPTLIAKGQIIQIEVTKRPTFKPYFSEALDQAIQVGLNEESTIQFPNHTYYEWEKSDSCKLTITHQPKDSSDIYDPVKDMVIGKSDGLFQVSFTPEYLEDSSEETKMLFDSMVRIHYFSIELLEEETGLISKYEWQIEVTSEISEEAPSDQENVSFKTLVEEEKKPGNETIVEKPEIEKEEKVKPVLDEKPLEFQLKKIRQDGLVEINFNQDLQVPKLSESQKSYDVNQRRLQSDSEGASLKDILSLNLNPSDQNYSIEVVEWTKRELKIRVNFDNPLQVSAMEQSTMSLEIKDVEFFKTKGGQKLSKELSKVTKQVPAQLPKNVTYESVEANAKTIENTSKSLIIVQILAAIFLKCNTNLMWVLIGTIQVIVYLLIYKIRFPANVEICLNVLRKVAEFKVVDQQDIYDAIGMQDPFRVKNNTVEDQEFERAGFNSSKMIDNLQEYVLASILVLVALGVLGILVLVLKKKRKQIMKKAKAFKNKMIWNGVIRSLQLTYLKATVACMIVLFKPWDDTVNLIIAGITFIVLLSQLIVFQKFLMRNHKDLWRQRIRNTYESLYIGLKVSQKESLYYPLAYLIRRLIFVIIAICQVTYPWLQLQMLLVLDCAYMWFVGYIRPFETKKVYRLVLLNEFLMLLLCYHLLCFTQWFYAELQYQSGQSFVCLICFIIALNILIMFTDIIKPLRDYIKWQRVTKQLWKNREKELKLEQEQKILKKKKKKEKKELREQQLKEEKKRQDDELTKALGPSREQMQNAVIQIVPSSQMIEIQKNIAKEEYPNTNQMTQAQLQQHRESEQIAQQINKAVQRDKIQIADRRQKRIKDNMKRIAGSTENTGKVQAKTKTTPSKFGRFQKSIKVLKMNTEKDLDTIPDVALGHTQREDDEDELQ